VLCTLDSFTLFLVLSFGFQLLTNSSISTPLRELRRLIRLRLAESRDIVGFNMAALRMVSRVANDRKQSFLDYDDSKKDVWAGLGLGSEVAAALEGKKAAMK
jgi:hypothetical protein